MEILKNHTGTVKFVVPNDLTSATYRVYKNDVQIGRNYNATVAAGVATAEVPYVVTTEDDQIKIVLRFIYGGDIFMPEKVVDVVTPYLDLWEVKQIIESNDDTEAARAEAAVRLIINSHCGQSFGFFTGVLSVTGSGDRVLRLPRRLIKFTSINASPYWHEAIAQRGGGWFLEFKINGIPGVKADYDGYHYERSGVIVAPTLWEGRAANPWGVSAFRRNEEYEIDGSWGWEDVPENIREAARLLINDYASGDSLYRDRFVQATVAADWQLEFNDGAFGDTGNARANKLLSEYVLRRGWTVL